MAGTVVRPLEKKIYFLINRIFNIDLSLSALISNPGTSLTNQLMNLLIFLVNHSMQLAKSSCIFISHDFQYFDFFIQPHLHTIVNRSMELAMSAKEPYNYFLLLRALFRSIGGGSHDLLYQEFLPLLPNLLQGRVFKIVHPLIMNSVFSVGPQFSKSRDDHFTIKTVVLGVFYD